MRGYIDIGGLDNLQKVLRPIGAMRDASRKKDLNVSMLVCVACPACACVRKSYHGTMGLALLIGLFLQTI